ncbi:MAG: ECF-type sigma factor [Phycisphaerales bacterium]
MDDHRDASSGPESADRARPDADATDEHAEALYHELRTLARKLLSRERPGHTLQPTALVNEAYLRLSAQNTAPGETLSREQFMAAFATTLRRILVEHARRRQAKKRGGGRIRLTLSPDQTPATSDTVDLLSLDDELDQLERLDARQARIVELRFFAGMTMTEVARTLEISERSAYYDWEMARAWLRSRLADEDPTP